MFAIPAVHCRQGFLGAVNDGVRAAGRDVEVFVGQQQCCFDNLITFGVKACHLQIYPYELVQVWCK